MPSIPERPTRDQAGQALQLLAGLLDEVAFIEGVEGAKSRSVGLSGLMTGVVRGAYPTAPGMSGALRRLEAAKATSKIWPPSSRPGSTAT